MKKRLLLPLLVLPLYVFGGCDTTKDPNDPSLPSGDDIELDVDQDGITTTDGDCDDNDPFTFPGAGSLEADPALCMTDADGDGFGDDTPEDGVSPGTDCNDGDAGTYPEAMEIPYDGIDQDCDGLDIKDVDDDGYDAIEAGGNDCDDNDDSEYPGLIWYPDADNDSFGSAASNGSFCERMQLNDVFDHTDCDDNDGNTYPGNLEITCNGHLEDCNSQDADINVPEDWATIQAGINAASEGAIVCVGPGTYEESLVISQPLALVGQQGSINTILQGPEASRILLLQDAPDTLVTGFTFLGGLASHENGGGILVLDSDGVQITDNVFSQNLAVHEVASGTFSTDLSIFNLEVPDTGIAELESPLGGGGGIAVQDSSMVEITLNTFSQNSAAAGGGVYLWRADNTLIQENEFTENSATYGGGLLSALSYEISFDTNSYTGNSAENDGGAVYISAGRDVNDLSVTANNNLYMYNVAFGAGGGLYTYRLQDISLYSSEFVGNESDYGAGLMSVGTPDIETTVSCGHCGFLENIAGISGGSIYSFNVRYISIQDSTFESNLAGYSGGAVRSEADEISTNLYMESDLTVQGSTFYNNGTPEVAGALYGYNLSNVAISDTIFEGNTSEFGGAIRVFANPAQTCHMSVANSEFHMNEATSIAGGLYAYNIESVSVSDCTFTQNHAPRGGGMRYFAQTGTDSVLTVDGTTFKENTCVDHGGGLYADNIDVVQVTNSSFHGNISEGHGGGIYALADESIESTIAIKWTSFSQNDATNFGGGFYGNGTTHATLTECQFENNTADRGAGMAMYNDLTQEGSLQIIGSSEFTNNTAESYGGGLYTSWVKSTEISDSNFTGNSAPRGGGARISGEPGLDTSFIVDNCDFDGNYGDVYGGGVYAYDITNMAITKSNFDGNGAETGGGFYTQAEETIAASLLVETTQFNSNTAALGGGGLSSLDILSTTVSDCTFQDNEASSGGGLRVFNNNGQITTLSASNLQFLDNTGSSGAGLYVGDISATVIDDSTFDNNTASSAEGGGIYASLAEIPGQTIEINTSTFINNYGNRGGGAFINGSSSAVLSGNQWNDNIGNLGGGALFVEESESAVITSDGMQSNFTNVIGGGIYCLNSTFSEVNTSVFDNLPDQVGCEGCSEGCVAR